MPSRNSGSFSQFPWACTAVEATAVNTLIRGVQSASIIQSATGTGRRRQFAVCHLCVSKQQYRYIPRQAGRATPTPTPIGHLRKQKDRPENQQVPHSLSRSSNCAIRERRPRVVITESRVSTAYRRRRRKDTGVTVRHDTSLAKADSRWS